MAGRVSEIWHRLNSGTDYFLNLFEIKNPRLRKIIPVIIFLISLHLFYSYVGIYDRLHERPCSIHASAQCERASVALNYYKVDMNFFKPRILVYNNDRGITGLEFPIIYYAGAVMYKLFGYDDVYLKILSLIITSAGFLWFYLLINSFVKNSIFSLFVIGGVIVSPVLLYYTANFMPDTPALAFVMAGWYFFYRYLSENKKKHLNLFAFFCHAWCSSQSGFSHVLCSCSLCACYKQAQAF